MTREEAIKAIKAWDFLDNDEKKVIETLIPELKESEDERIRKALIDFFQDWHKTKPSRWSIPVSDVITWLEKQGKSKWSEKDENFFANICSIIDTDRNFTEFAKRRCKEWLESLKDRVQLQNMWKPSKEQIVALRWILNNIPYNKHKEEISGLLDQIKHL